MFGRFFTILLVALVAFSTTAFEMSPIQKVQNTSEGLSLCPLCIDFMNEALNNLIGILEKGGVIGGCAELCRLLPNQLEATVCDLLCTVVGIEEFSKLVNDADPDPLWLCMELHACPIRDNAAANITNLSVNPSSGPVGAEFTISMTFAVLNETGVGEVEIAVVPPQPGMPFGTNKVITSLAPGSYSSSFDLKTQPSEGEPFMPGKYGVVAAICEGTCGSSHSHSFTMAQKQTSFELQQ